MEIARQLDLSLLPDGYVFLRNVGRHLTWVSGSGIQSGALRDVQYSTMVWLISQLQVTAKQEPKLKAKLFVPPLVSQNS